MPTITTVAKIHRRLQGTVVSDKMSKTRVVLVERWKRHPKYKKSYRVHRRYKVHDPEHVSHVGDRVIFEECRPLSKEKRWQFVKVVSHVPSRESTVVSREERLRVTPHASGLTTHA